jgi:hypothetical protein
MSEGLRQGGRTPPPPLPDFGPTLTASHPKFLAPTLYVVTHGAPRFSDLATWLLPEKFIILLFIAKFEQGESGWYSALVVVSYSHRFATNTNVLFFLVPDSVQFLTESSVINEWTISWTMDM